MNDPARVVANSLPAQHPDQPESAFLHLLVRTPEQLDAALTLSPASITLDYLDLYGLKPSVERVRSSGIEVRVASPRILKPGEEKIANFLLSLDSAILVRSAGLIEMIGRRATKPLIGDFSLNAANSIAADLLLRSGLSATYSDARSERIASSRISLAHGRQQY